MSDTTPERGDDGLDPADGVPAWVLVLIVVAAILGALWLLQSFTGVGGSL